MAVSRLFGCSLSGEGSDSFAFFALGSVRVERSTFLWDASEIFLFLISEMLFDGMILLLRLDCKGVFSLLVDAPAVDSTIFWPGVEYEGAGTWIYALFLRGREGEETDLRGDDGMADDDRGRVEGGAEPPARLKQGDITWSVSTRDTSRRSPEISQPPHAYSSAFVTVPPSVHSPKKTTWPTQIILATLGAFMT